MCKLILWMKPINQRKSCSKKCCMVLQWIACWSWTGMLRLSQSTFSHALWTLGTTKAKLLVEVYIYPWWWNRLGKGVRIWQTLLLPNCPLPRHDLPSILPLSLPSLPSPLQLLHVSLSTTAWHLYPSCILSSSLHKPDHLLLVVARPCALLMSHLWQLWSMLCWPECMFC